MRRLREASDMSAVPELKPNDLTRRLTINLPSRVFQDLESLSKASQRTMTETIRTALSLAKVAFEEELNDHRIAVLDENDEVLWKLKIS